MLAGSVNDAARAVRLDLHAVHQEPVEVPAAGRDGQGERSLAGGEEAHRRRSGARLVGDERDARGRRVDEREHRRGRLVDGARVGPDLGRHGVGADGGQTGERPGGDGAPGLHDDAVEQELVLLRGGSAGGGCGEEDVTTHLDRAGDVGEERSARWPATGCARCRRAFRCGWRASGAGAGLDLDRVGLAGDRADRGERHDPVPRRGSSPGRGRTGPATLRSGARTGTRPVRTSGSASPGSSG